MGSKRRNQWLPSALPPILSLGDSSKRPPPPVLPWETGAVHTNSSCQQEGELGKAHTTYQRHNAKGEPKLAGVIVVIIPHGSSDAAGPHAGAEHRTQLPLPMEQQHLESHKHLLCCKQ